jgi:hypothetical protein
LDFSDRFSCRGQRAGGEDVGIWVFFDFVASSSKATKKKIQSIEGRGQVTDGLQK